MNPGVPAARLVPRRLRWLRGRAAAAAVAAAVVLACGSHAQADNPGLPAQPPPATPAAPPEGPAPGEGAGAVDDPEALAMAPLLAAVEQAAREPDVRALMRHPAVRQERFALAAALRLGHAGGPWAALALRTLLTHASRDVKYAALLGIARVGLRTRGTATDDRELLRVLRGEDPDLRRLAVEALGRVGHAEDVELLVASLAAEDGPVLLAAEQALGRLTGVVHGRSAGRWSSWWQRNREPLQRAVAVALDTLEDIGGGRFEEEPEAQATLESQAWALVTRDAWLLLPEVSRRARDWMMASDPEVRARGYRLAAALRSLDLAEDLGRAQRMGEADAAAAAALEQALRGYGMPPLEPARDR